MKGIIFDIKEFSLHDGPGGRTTVFLKGCPLRCLWCHNPEGLKKEPQLMVKESLCKHCGRCLRSCTHIECMPFGRCIHACPDGLVTVAGQEMEASELSARLMKQKAMLESTGGGVTFSGGEPLMQPDFLFEILDLLPGVHKAIQTSGYAAEEVFQKAIGKVDYVMMDVKAADPAKHRELTGVSNERILKNLSILKASGVPFVIRVPLIPDLTDTEDNLRAIAEIAGTARVELLKYNTFAGAKYEMVGMTYPAIANENREIDLKWFQNACFG